MSFSRLNRKEHSSEAHSRFFNSGNSMFLSMRLWKHEHNFFFSNCADDRRVLNNNDMYPFATPFVSVFTVVLQVSGKKKSMKQKWIKRKQKREEKKQRYNHFLGWTGKHWRTWRSRLGWTNGMFCSFLWNYLFAKLFDPFLGPNGKLRPQVINCTVAPEKLMVFLLFLNSINVQLSA